MQIPDHRPVNNYGMGIPRESNNRSSAESTIRQESPHIPPTRQESQVSPRGSSQVPRQSTGSDDIPLPQLDRRPELVHRGTSYVVTEPLKLPSSQVLQRLHDPERNLSTSSLASWYTTPEYPSLPPTPDSCHFPDEDRQPEQKPDQDTEPKLKRSSSTLQPSRSNSIVTASAARESHSQRLRRADTIAGTAEPRNSSLATVTSANTDSSASSAGRNKGESGKVSKPPQLVKAPSALQIKRVPSQQQNHSEQQQQQQQEQHHHPKAGKTTPAVAAVAAAAAATAITGAPGPPLLNRYSSEYLERYKPVKTASSNTGLNTLTPTSLAKEPAATSQHNRSPSFRTSRLATSASGNQAASNARPPHAINRRESSMAGGGIGQVVANLKMRRGSRVGGSRAEATTGRVSEEHARGVTSPPPPALPPPPPPPPLQEAMVSRTGPLRMGPAFASPSGHPQQQQGHQSQLSLLAQQQQHSLHPLLPQLSGGGGSGGGGAVGGVGGGNNGVGHGNAAGGGVGSTTTKRRSVQSELKRLFGR